MRMVKRQLRIHGDNIVECERTLNMIAETFHASAELQKSPVYFPKYAISTSDSVFEIELLSGHGRWSNIDLGEIVHQSGGLSGSFYNSVEIRNYNR